MNLKYEKMQLQSGKKKKLKLSTENVDFCFALNFVDFNLAGKVKWFQVT